MHWGSYLFSFHGRVNRAKWWLFILISIIYTFAAFAVSVALLGFAGLLLGYILLIVLIWPSIAIGVKRLHDRGKSGWWLLLFYLVPSVLNGFNMSTTGDMGLSAMRHPTTLSVVISLVSLAISLWALVEFGILRGTTGDNKYGPDPLAHVAAKPA